MAGRFPFEQSAANLYNINSPDERKPSGSSMSISAMLGGGGQGRGNFTLPPISSVAASLDSSSNAPASAGSSIQQQQQQQQPQLQASTNSAPPSAGGQYAGQAGGLGTGMRPPGSSSFVFQMSDGNPTFQLPPVQFASNAVDRRRQNLGPSTSSPPPPTNPTAVSSPPDAAPARAEDAMARLKKLSAGRVEEQPQQEAAFHHHHHHHRHHHHHHHHGDEPQPAGESAPAPASAPAPPPISATTTMGPPEEQGPNQGPTPGPGSTIQQLSNHSSGAMIEAVTTLQGIATDTEDQAPATIKSTVHVKNDDVTQAAKIFQRQSLGCILYKEHTDVLLPRMDEHINCTVQVRIPYQYLNQYNEGVVKRKVWGTDVYTDESDVVAALYHCGILKFDVSDETDTEQEEADNQRSTKVEDNKETKTTEEDGKETEKEKEIEKEKEKEKEKEETQEPPKQESQQENGNDEADRTLDLEDKVKSKKKESKDCIATLLILPTLESYTGSCRNGVNSRTWTTLHDGVSYQIVDAQFLPCGTAESMASLRKRRIEGWCALRSHVKKPRKSIYWHENEFL